MKRLTQIFQALLGVVALIFTAIIAFGRLAWRTIRNWWKNRSKWFRRSIVAIFIIVPVGFVALVAYVLYEDEYGRDYYDRRLSDNITLHSFSDNKWRVYDKQAGEYTTDKINWLSEVPENDSLAVYALPNKRGYINVNTGRIVIDAEANDYRKAWVFSDGLAAVMKDDKIGFINANNEVVIPFQFDYTDKCRMWDFGYVFHNGYCAMPNADGDLGLIDKSGNWVVEPMYDEIWKPASHGYRVVIKDGKYGAVGPDCKLLHPAEYYYINIVSDGVVLTQGGRQWKEDFEGNVLIPFLVDDVEILEFPNDYDYEQECSIYEYSRYAKYNVVGRYGILDRFTGEVIAPAIYSDIHMVSDSLFKVQEHNIYEWYLLDTDGNMITDSGQGEE